MAEAELLELTALERILRTVFFLPDKYSKMRDESKYAKPRIWMLPIRWVLFVVSFSLLLAIPPACLLTWLPLAIGCNDVFWTVAIHTGFLGLVALYDCSCWFSRTDMDLPDSGIM